MKTLMELSPQQLRKAAQIKEQMAALERQLQLLLGTTGTSFPRSLKNGNAPVPSARRSSSGSSSKGKTMSAAQKAKIAETMRQRWARIKAGKR